MKRKEPASFLTRPFGLLVAAFNRRSTCGNITVWLVASASIS
jgi:hypothetical protein